MVTRRRSKKKAGESFPSLRLSESGWGAIVSGNLWGLRWSIPEVFDNTETPSEVVSETINILSMWTRLEDSFANLSQEDKDWLAENAGPFGKHVKFSGFDGNNEVQYISAARFLIESLDRFPKFKGRDLNAHMQTIEAYRRMLDVFEPILSQVSHLDFNAAQIAEVVNARIHPSNR